MDGGNVPGQWTEWRCPHCGALLQRYASVEGSWVAEIRCWRCKRYLRLVYTQEQPPEVSFVPAPD